MKEKKTINFHPLAPSTIKELKKKKSSHTPSPLNNKKKN
jgi:hypothetical protein